MQKIANEDLGRPSLEEFKAQDKRPIVVVLDNVRSMQNVGSAFRTADGFGIEKIMLCGITAKPPHRDINKAALGATESMVWEYEKNTLTAVKILQERGYKVFAVEQVEDAISLDVFSIKQKEKVAFVFGHEIKGVQQAVIDICDGAIEIPQFGTKHSFNVSVSVGIVLWQAIRE